MWAAVCVSSLSRTEFEAPVSTRIASVRRPGRSSRNVSRRLLARSVCWIDRPVMLPPGRAKEVTRPVPTGSSLRENPECPKNSFFLAWSCLKRMFEIQTIV